MIFIEPVNHPTELKVGNAPIILNMNGFQENGTTIPISESCIEEERRKALRKIVSFCALVPSLKPSIVYDYESPGDEEDRIGDSPLSGRYFDEFGFRIDDLGKSSGSFYPYVIRHKGFEFVALEFHTFVGNHRFSNPVNDELI